MRDIKVDVFMVEVISSISVAGLMVKNVLKSKLLTAKMLGTKST